MSKGYSTIENYNQTPCVPSYVGIRNSEVELITSNLIDSFYTSQGLDLDCPYTVLVPEI